MSVHALPLLASLAITSTAPFVAPFPLHAQDAQADTVAFLAAAFEAGIRFRGEIWLANGRAAYEIVDYPPGEPVHARRPPHGTWDRAVLEAIACRMSGRETMLCEEPCRREGPRDVVVRLGTPESEGEGFVRVVVEYTGGSEVGQYIIVLEPTLEGPRSVERRIGVVSIRGRP